jgi:hypothetical protein
MLDGSCAARKSVSRLYGKWCFYDFDELGDVAIHEDFAILGAVDQGRRFTNGSSHEQAVLAKRRPKNPHGHQTSGQPTTDVHPGHLVFLDDGLRAFYLVERHMNRIEICGLRSVPRAPKPK